MTMHTNAQQDCDLRISWLVCITKLEPDLAGGDSCHCCHQASGKDDLKNDICIMQAGVLHVAGGRSMVIPSLTVQKPQALVLLNLFVK